MAQQPCAEIVGSKLVVFREMKNGILTEIPDRVADTMAVFFQSVIEYSDIVSSR